MTPLPGEIAIPIRNFSGNSSGPEREELTSNQRERPEDNRSQMCNVRGLGQRLKKLMASHRGA
jgi:hypothetical protein